MKKMKIKPTKTWIIIGVVLLIGLYIGRKSVKTSICSFHKFGFCQASASIFEPLSGPTPPGNVPVDPQSLISEADRSNFPECYEGSSKYNPSKCDAIRKGLKLGHGG